MKTRLFALMIVLALTVTPALAQGGTPHSVTYDGFGFQIDPAIAANLVVIPTPGDPVDLQQPGGPEVAHIQFILYNGTPAPESPFDAPGSIRVYKIADFKGYDFPTQRLTQLQTLLSSKADLTPYMAMTDQATDNNLPFMPVIPAGQIIRARAVYVDLPTITGISFVTAFAQDVSPFISTSFMYSFQGISKDGTYYVSAVFKLSAAAFPAEIPADFNYDTFSQGYADYMTKSIATLNSAAPDQFTPSITALDAVFQSFAFGQ